MDLQEKENSKPRPGTLLCVALFGIFLLVTGYALGFKILPEFVETEIWKGVILKNNTEQWRIFEKIPFPFIFKVYMFNITNIDEVLQGAKPMCSEVGPYIYKYQLYKWKQYVQLVEDGVISYRNRERYEFDQVSSGNLSDDDVVTILNPVWNSVIQTAEANSADALPLLNRALPYVFGDYNSLFISISVKQFLFDGFTLCDKNRFKEGGFAVKVVCSQIRSTSTESKGMLPLDDHIVFSYFYSKNAKASGTYSINSGMSKKEEFGEILLFENDSYLHIWGEENNHCNKIQSSLALFKPFVMRNSNLEIFVEDICRIVIMDYMREETYLDITGYQFEMRPDTLDVPKFKEECQCFCLNTTRDLDGSHCLASGLLDLQNCVGALMIFSYPHLLWADPKYAATVEGLQPMRDLHSSFVVLEPYTGTLLKMSKTAQFNMFIRPVDGIDSIRNVSEAIVPLLWVEESMQLPEKYTNLLKDTLLKGLKRIEMVKWGLISMGVGLTILGMGCVIWYY